MHRVLRGILGFEWDAENSGKNEKKHGVTDREAEEVFFNEPILIARSAGGGDEVRYAALGKTLGARLLTVIFTLRDKRIRVISAGPMGRSEREIYEKED